MGSKPEEKSAAATAPAAYTASTIAAAFEDREFTSSLERVIDAVITRQISAFESRILANFAQQARRIDEIEAAVARQVGLNRLAAPPNRDADNLDTDPGWAQINFDQGSEAMPGEQRTTERKYVAVESGLTDIIDRAEASLDHEGINARRRQN